MLNHPAEPWPDRPPYRPFLGGPPRFAVGAAPIPKSVWLRGNPEAAANAENRAAVLAARPGDAVKWDTASLPAQAEALAMIAGHLGGPAPPSDAADIVRAGALTSDDLVIMEKRAGVWRATALILTAPTFFVPSEAFGADLAALHKPVPGAAPSLTSIGLAGRIGALFDRTPADQVLQRFNWTLQCGTERWAPSGSVLRARAAEMRSELCAAALHLRVERQTIRHLPETGAVLFTIRVCLDPVSALAPELLATLANAWRGADEAARRYKAWDPLDEAAQLAFARS